VNVRRIPKQLAAIVAGAPADGRPQVSHNPGGSRPELPSPRISSRVVPKHRDPIVPPPDNHRGSNVH